MFYQAVHNSPAAALGCVGVCAAVSLRHSSSAVGVLWQACMGLSDGQMQDLLTLRHLFFAQVGCLTSERITLMHDMAMHSQQLQKVEVWAERLKQNILEEHQCYLQTITAAYLGVSHVPALNFPHHAWVELSCTVLCCTMLCRAVLYYAVPCCAVPYCAVYG